MAKMSYQEAEKIRKTGLANLIANRLVEGEGIGSSFTKSLSERTKANVTGLKQKVDYLNIAKKLTGGSNLVPALLGRLTGRNTESIRFFAGKGSAKPVSDKATKIDGAGQLEQTEAIYETLDNIYGFLKDSNDEYERKKQEEEGKLEEKEMERKRRHDDLLKLLGYTPGKPTATKVNDDENDESFLAKFLRMLGISKDVWKNLKYALGILGLVGGMVGFYGGLLWLVNYAADKMTNWAAITPNQAAEMLQRNDPREMEKYGGRERLEELVKEGPSRAKELLEQYNNPDLNPLEKEIIEKKIKMMGGLPLVKQIVAEGEVKEFPEPMGELPQNVPPRPDTSNGQNQTRAKIWDNKFGKYYNHDGTLKDAYKKSESALPKKVLEAFPETGEPTNKAAVQNQGRRITAIPAEQKQLNTAIKENLDLQLPQPVVDAVNQVVNNTTVNSQDTSQVAIIPMPSVRNQEPTFQEVILYSTRVV